MITIHPPLPLDRPSRWERPALASGVPFAVLQLVAVAFFIMVLVPRMPGIDAPVTERSAFYAEHDGLLTVGNYLLVLPAPFFLLFLGGLFGVLRRAEGGSGTLSVATVAAGIAMAMTWPMGIVISGLGISIATDGGDAATVSALDGMAPLSLALSALPRVVLLVATSVLLLSAAIGPRWLGLLGVVLALISLVGSATLLVSDLFPVLSLGTLLFELWVLALSVSLVWRARTTIQRVAHAAPA